MGTSTAAAPSARRDFTHWPVPVGRVRVVRDLTFVHAPAPGGFSVEDVRGIPDARVELYRGVLAVRPDLTPAHRQVLNDLYEELRDKCPGHLVPFDGRLDVQIGTDTIFSPDLQVLSRAGEDPPRVLVVDALPDRDKWYRAPERDTKRHGYRRAGIPSYWIVDPITSTVAVYEVDHLARSKFRCDRVCDIARRGRWGPWSRSA